MPPETPSSIPQALVQAFPEYFFERKLGQGSYGSVYLVRQYKLKRYEAMKVLNETVTEDNRSSLEEEAAIISSLSDPEQPPHPSIPSLYAILEREGKVAFTSAYIEGKSLSEFIRETYLSGAEIPKATAIPIVKQVASALRYAHERGIVHRDIKPGNIIINKGGHVQVIDFGIAQVTRKLGAKAQGTLPYMPLEQILGGGDGRVDIYALGTVLFELVTGVIPWHDAHDEKSILKKKALSGLSIPGEAHIDPGLESIIRKALAPDPDERYQTMKEFEGALEAYERWMPRRRFLKMVGAAGLLIGGASAARSIIRWEHSIGHIIENIRRTHPQDFSRLAPLFLELAQGLATKKIRRLYEDTIPEDLFPYATQANDEWYPESARSWIAGYSIRILRNAYALTGNPFFLDMAGRKSGFITFAPDEVKGFNPIRFLHAGKNIEEAAAYYAQFMRNDPFDYIDVTSAFRSRFSSLLPDERVIHIGSTESILPLILAAAHLLEGKDPARREMYLRTVRGHTDAIKRYLIREDCSTGDLAKFNLRGDLVERGQKNAISKSSCWAKGQAIAAGWLSTLGLGYEKAAFGTAEFYTSHLPPDLIPYYDLLYDPAAGGIRTADGSISPFSGMEKDTYPLLVMAEYYLDAWLAGGSEEGRRRSFAMMHALMKNHVNTDPGSNVVISQSCDNLISGDYTRSCVIWTVDRFFTIMDKIKKDYGHGSGEPGS